MYGKYLLVAAFVAVFAAARGNKEMMEKMDKECLEPNGYTFHDMMKMKKEKVKLCGNEKAEKASTCMMTLFGHFDGNALNEEKLVEDFLRHGVEEDVQKLKDCIVEAQAVEPHLKSCALNDCKTREEVRCMKHKKKGGEDNKIEEEVAADAA